MPGTVFSTLYIFTYFSQELYEVNTIISILQMRQRKIKWVTQVMGLGSNPGSHWAQGHSLGRPGKGGCGGTCHRRDRAVNLPQNPHPQEYVTAQEESTAVATGMSRGPDNLGKKGCGSITVATAMLYSSHRCAVSTHLAHVFRDKLGATCL